MFQKKFKNLFLFYFEFFFEFGRLAAKLLVPTTAWLWALPKLKEKNIIKWKNIKINFWVQQGHSQAIGANGMVEALLNMIFYLFLII
jgi:hypothetical protein